MSAAPQEPLGISTSAGTLEVLIRPGADGGFEIRLRVDSSGTGALPTEAGPAPTQLSVVPAAPAAAPDPATTAAPAEPAALAEPEPTPGTPVKAPLIGVFYRSPTPGEDPFVEVGARVAKGDSLGIVEAMKMMNHIPAPVSGTVTAIEAGDTEVVEFDQVLVRLAPDGAP